MKRGLVLMPALAISALLMLFAYILVPHGSYAREEHVAALGNRFRLVASQMGRFGRLWQMAGSGAWGYTWLGRFDGGIWYFNTQVVNIADSGVRVFTDQSLLEIVVDEPGTFYLHGFTMNHFDGRSWRDDDEIPQIDRVGISWPSIFSNINDWNDQVVYSNELEEYFSSEEEIIHRLSRLRYERDEVRSSLGRRLEVTAEEMELFLNDDEAFLIFLEEMLEQQRERVEQEEERFEEIIWEINVLTAILFSMQNPYLTEYYDIDLARTMPAFISEFYTINNFDNLPVRVTMDVNRTGDLTAGITYTPYYGGFFVGDNVVRNADNTFYYVRGSVLRLAESVFETHSIIASEIGDGSTTFDSFERYGSIFAFPVDTLTDALSNYSERIRSTGVYTEIDPYTAQGLRRLAIDAGINPNADRAVVADAVARYVRDSSEYSLAPGQIPFNEDFALYFLQESYGGYCIHFATAAVLMLRALDIPARFASGYVVTVEPWQVGGRVTLTDRNAHAWVEVFYEDVGWLYLEATPSSGNPFIPEPRPHRPDADYNVQNTPPPGWMNDNFNEDDWEDDFGPFYDNGGPVSIGTDSDEQDNAEQLPSWMIDVITAFICFVLVSVALVIRRVVAKKLRVRNFEQQNANKAVLCMWRYIVRLGHREIVAPNEIEELALKARFSQHRISEEEREIMVKYTNRLAFELCNGKEGFSRLWLKYIRALC
jgi:transglutaminase-like putative cysteine protease